MQTHLRAALVAISALVGVAARAQTPLGAAFTYQGELALAGSPATGSFDIRFRLFDAPTGGSQVGSTLCSDDVAVTSGRFAASLDFGSAAFNGHKRFLEIEVRQNTGLDCSDATGYTVLSPRQELTVAPHASYSLMAASAQTASNAQNLNGQPPSFFTSAANLTGTLASGLLSGTYSSPLTLSNPSNVFTGNGAGLTNLSAANLVGVLDAARMPTNWAAGGDLSGFYPSPAIRPGAVTLSTLEPSVQSVLSRLSSLTSAAVPLDAVVWGDSRFGRLNIPVLPPGVTYTALAAGALHNIALRSDGNVVAWGDGSGGNLNVPALPPGLTYSGAIACGDSHSLARRSDGSVVAWGSNLWGQLNVPALPPGVTFTAVAAGANFSAGLRSDGSVVVWGRNLGGALNPPALPPGLTYTSLAAGLQHLVVRRSDGALISTGWEVYGLLDVPALPYGLTYSAVASGGFFSVALRSDGTLVAWGQSDLGQLAVPALPPGVTYTSTFVCGWDHALALRSDGVLVAWGSNSLGQLNVPGLSGGLGYVGLGAGGESSMALRSISAPPWLSSTVGLSIGTTAAPPAGGGISVAGSSAFAAGVSAAFFTGSGAGLTNLNAANIVSGTLGDGLLSGNIPRLNANNSFSGSQQTFAGNVLVGGLDNVALGLDAQSAPRLGLIKKSGFLPMIASAANQPIIFAQSDQAGVLTNIAGATLTERFRIAANGNIQVPGGVITNGTAAIPTADLGLYSQNSFWMRFVTNSAAFQWFSDGGAGTTPRMTLSPTGNLTVTGTIAKAGGSFKIDHPLDPENKYLYHSFVESPDMMNIYNGEATTDGTGYAVITLPDYFQALNRDFRYQLTVIDDDDQADVVVWAKVVRRIGADRPNTFTIRTFRPNIAVSWQVTGIRQDAWAKKNRIPNTVEKVGAEKGTLLHPEAFAKPSE
jgi:hypothetical protein